MPTLRVNVGHPYVCFDAVRGSRSPVSASAEPTSVCVRCELETDIGDIAFYVLVKVKKLYASSETKAQEFAVAWLANQLPEHFRQPNYWNFFQCTEFRPEELPITTEVKLTQAFSVDLDLSPGLQKTVEESIAHLSQVRLRFVAAKERLWELVASNSPFGFAQTTEEARNLLRIIEETLSASSDAGSNEPYEARSALDDYEELARRKVEANHNYQSALTSLKYFVSGVTFPSTWTRRPDA